MKILSKLATGLAAVGLLSCSAIDQNVVESKEWPQVDTAVEKNKSYLNVETITLNQHKKLDVMYVEEGLIWTRHKEACPLDKFKELSSWRKKNLACQSLEYFNNSMNLTLLDADCDNKIDYVRPAITLGGWGFDLSVYGKLTKKEKKLIKNYQKFFDAKKKDLSEAVGRDLDSLAEGWLKEIKKD